MKKNWLWGVSVSWISLSIFLSLPLFSSEFNPKQHLLSQKRHQKMERRLEKNKGKKNDYFLKKKTLLNKRYALKQRRLFRKKNKIPQKQYDKIEAHLQKWYRREINQLTYQEEKFKKRVARHEERLTHFR